MNTTPSGLKYEDPLIGNGPTATVGKNVRVHYTGWLYNDGSAGRKFDSSKDRGDPFEFVELLVREIDGLAREEILLLVGQRLIQPEEVRLE